MPNKRISVRVRESAEKFLQIKSNKKRKRKEAMCRDVWRGKKEREIETEMLSCYCASEKPRSVDELVEPCVHRKRGKRDVRNVPSCCV